MKFKPEFCIANEEPVKEERLTIADELRFGFTTAVRSKPYRNEFDLSKSELPPIGYMSFNENELKKDRLDSLKNKFGKLLNLAEKE